MAEESAHTETAPRVAFVTLGCKVNQAESDAIAAALPSGAVSADAASAAVVVINTCTVTGEADHKARKAVRHALALPGSPTVVVTGCLASIDPVGLEALGQRVVVEPDKLRVADRVREIGGIDGTAVPGALARRSRVQLKVQDGCDAFCAYCIVPYARGVPRAVPLAQVVAEAEALAAAGVAEVVLTGINIGRYDDDGRDLADVVRAVVATGIPRVRLSSVEPRNVDDRLLATIASAPAVCNHLHVPLQSGSDTVLARMGRPYDARGFAGVIERVREAVPGCAVSTDVIAGFPGESDGEHAETMALVEEIGFARMHVFRYSVRSGTRAAGMPDQVPPEVRAARAAELRAAGTARAAHFARTLVGREVELLVERVRRIPGAAEGLAEGTTREYLRMTVPQGTARPGDLLRARVGRIDADGRVEGVASEPGAEMPARV